METLKHVHPIAHKKHKCMLCGGTIEIGEKYERQTVAHDGTVNDFINHERCSDLINELGMCDDMVPDEEFTQDIFEDCINQYVYDTHCNFKRFDFWNRKEYSIDEGWDADYPELVPKILAELKKIT